jgi:type IV pilus assembly protein PilC
VEGGTSFSQALQFYPKEFTSFYVNIVKSGEVGGKLSDSLNYLADHLEREYNLQTKIQGALIYPAFVLLLFFIVAVVMGILVLPGLISIVESAGQEVSLITKIVIAFSNFFEKSGWIVILAVIGLGIFFYRYFKTPEGKKIFDKYSLNIPGLGTLLKKIYLTRFAENLTTLIAAGLPITKALEITGDVVGNEVYKSVILKTMDEVRKGEPISSVLERYPETISPFFVQMTLVGEKSGQLDNILLYVVDFYQREVDSSVESFMKLLEPILIIFLGVVVGGLAVSLLLPLYQTIGTF